VVALCEGAGATLYILEVHPAQFLSGATAAFGALFTIWMILVYSPTNVAFLFVFVGASGAMPGCMVFFFSKRSFPTNPVEIALILICRVNRV
jgi:hypothetical protein